jgi:hypothetical protein
MITKISMLSIAAATLLLSTHSWSCDPGGKSFGSRSFANKSGYTPGFSKTAYAPYGNGYNAAFAQKRQVLAAQIAARNARMKPIRIARARHQREYLIAQRQRNRELLAKRLEKKRLQRQFANDRVLLANLRSVPGSGY